MIISKKGFQSGAAESRQSTNIHLLSFAEFQTTFFGEWRTGMFMRFAKMSDLLRPLVPMHPDYLDNTSLQERLRSVEIFKKYEVFFGEHRFSEYFIGRKPIDVTIIDPRGDPRSLARIRIQSYRQYYEIARQGCADAREYFRI